MLLLMYKTVALSTRRGLSSFVTVFSTYYVNWGLYMRIRIRFFLGLVWLLNNALRRMSELARRHGAQI